jgi:ribonucleoside-diphosphate reductase alpha chain
MKIKKITRNVALEPTWDVSTNDETYTLSNGVVSHNTSAQISNSTNGIEPVRSLVTIKISKDGVLKQVVPEVRKLKNKYDLLWDQKSPEGYMKICAVLQKFIDQGISVNTSYNPHNYDGDQIPLSILIKDVVTFYRYGGKQLYYCNTADGAGEMPMPELVQDDIDDEDCDSCKI